jgi:hypothetical protein
MGATLEYIHFYVKYRKLELGTWYFFSVFDTRSSDTSTPVFDTDTLILFKIPGSDTGYSDTSDTLQKHKKNEEKSKPPLSPLQVQYIQGGP